MSGCNCVSMHHVQDTCASQEPTAQRLGLYPRDTIPDPDRKEAAPVDRKEGMKRYEQARQENAARIAAEKEAAK